jgi:hypothetical protein
MTQGGKLKAEVRNPKAEILEAEISKSESRNFGSRNFGADGRPLKADSFKPFNERKPLP